MKKEIWIHIDSYRPNGNAPANRAFAFAKFFSNQGYKINVITIGKEDRVDCREEATVYYIKDIWHFKKKNLINRLLDNITFSRKTLSFIKRNKNVISNSFFLVSVPEYIAGSSCIKAKRYGAMLITDIRDIWPEVAIEMGIFKSDSLKAKIFKHYAQKYYKNSDYIFTVSKRKTEYLQTLTNHTNDEKVVWVGNGFDIDTLALEADDSILQQYDLKDKFVISYAGNVGKAQHLISLLEYAKKVNGLTNDIFIIAGNGGELDNLKQYSKDNKLTNTIFTGTVTKEQAKAITCSSNVSFIPLSSDKMLDSVPTKLFESLGLGVPVILVANGESVDILNESQFGLSVLPSNINQIDDVFSSFKKQYSSIIGRKEIAVKLMQTKYSRQKYCGDFEKIISEHVG